MYAPAGDAYKVYFIDQAHDLTKNAWTAILQLVEEPPPRVAFVFVTTQPEMRPTALFAA